MITGIMALPFDVVLQFDAFCCFVMPWMRERDTEIFSLGVVQIAIAEIAANSMKGDLVPILDNPQHERFALMVASGLSPTKAYVQVGLGAHEADPDADRLTKNDDVSMRIAEANIEISQRTMAGIVRRGIADLNTRLREYQERWDEIRQAIDGIIAERGEEMSRLQTDVAAGPDGVARPYYVAGGSTGFIITEYRGKEGTVPVYRVDTDLIQLYYLLLDLGERVSKELGQWGKRNVVSEEEKKRPDFSKLTDASTDY